MDFSRRAFLATASGILLSQCGGEPSANGPGTGASTKIFTPVDSANAVFWVRFSTEIGDLLKQIVDEYNATNKGLPIKSDYIGNYSEIYKKITAGIQARTLPAMAVSYESMTTEYIQSGAAVALDDYLARPEGGISGEELKDFFPSILASNRFPEFDNHYYSFPFSKSILVMYFNRNVMKEAGLDTPPSTWDEFLEQCRQVKAKTGKYATALTVDCSTFDGLVFSMGGAMMANGETLYDRPESIRAFKVIETLVAEKLAYQVTPGTFDDDNAMSQDNIAFSLRTSSGKPYIATLMGGYNDRWGIARIPQADASKPKTVLYGPNICIFQTTPEQQEAAWAFARHFVSPEISARWAVGSGYMPVRRAALNHEIIQKTFSEWEYHRVPYDCLEYAEIEPNVAGWQEVRPAVEKAMTAVLGGVRTAEQAGADLKKEADAILSRY